MISVTITPDAICRALLTNSGIDANNLDINKCVITGRHLINDFTASLNNGDYIPISISNVISYRTIIFVPELETCVITPENLFNLNCASDSRFRVDLKREIVFEKNNPKIVKSNFPLRATLATVSLIETAVNIDNRVIDWCMLHYFNEKKYFQSGDIFSIDTVACDNKIKCASDFPIPARLSFKMNRVEGPKYDFISNNDIRFGYLVDKDTKLIQESKTSCFLPPAEFTVRRDSLSGITCKNFQEHQIPLLPRGMESIYSDLEKAILPFISQRNSGIKLDSIFLLSGSKGCGKSTLLSCLAKKYGLRYYRKNCADMQNGAKSLLFDTALANISKSTKNLSPCILQMSNIEAFFEEEYAEYDGRVFDHLMSFKSDVFKNINYPIFVFCTTSHLAVIPGSLRSMFLQTFEIEPLSQLQRSQILEWILKCKGTRCDGPLDGISKIASGLAFSDLIRLVQKAEILHSENCPSENDLTSTREILVEDFQQTFDDLSKKRACALGAVKNPNVEWGDIGGLAHHKEEILSSLAMMTLSADLHRSGLLLHGPPGTGKTLLAKAVATECKYNFLSVKGPELLNMFMGQSELNIRQVFERAKASAPCIIFFDELDSLAPRRSNNSLNSIDRVVSQLLTEMDGLEKKEGIFILAATNRPDLIDPALLRPGRLDKMLYVGPAEDKQSKLSVLKALTRKFTFSEDVNLEKFVDAMPDKSLTGADFYGVCSNAWLNAARRNIISKNEKETYTSGESVVVCWEDIKRAISSL